MCPQADVFGTCAGGHRARATQSGHQQRSSDRTSISGNRRPFLVLPQAPAPVGDVLVFYGAGLGVTTPSAIEGVASPSSPLPQASATMVVIGRHPAAVSFAGLTPGFVGLYQINTQVPSGSSVAGQTSPVGTLAVH